MDSLPHEIHLLIFDKLDESSLFRIIQASRNAAIAAKRVLFFRRINENTDLKTIYLLAKAKESSELCAVQQMHLYSKFVLPKPPLKFSKSKNCKLHAFPNQIKQIGLQVDSQVNVSKRFYEFKLKESKLRLKISKLYHLNHCKTLSKHDFPFQSYELDLLLSPIKNDQITIVIEKVCKLIKPTQSFSKITKPKEYKLDKLNKQQFLNFLQDFGLEIRYSMTSGHKISSQFEEMEWVPETKFQCET